MSFSPLFMFGFERSGTTLLSMMMGAHPHLAVPLSTTGMWYRVWEEWGEPTDLPGSGRSVSALVDRFMREERIGLWDADLDVEDVAELRTYADVVRALHQAYACAKGKRYWASMDISTIFNVDVVNAWFPDARFLHIVRDGRDVALSHETYVYGKRNTLDCAEHWERTVSTQLLLAKVLGRSRYLTIRYEDLVLEPEATLSVVCDFVGLEYSTQMLEYTSMVDEKIPDDKRFLWPSLNQPPTSDKVYRWKQAMPPRKQQIMHRIGGELLGELGYEPTEHARRTVGGLIFDVWCQVNHGGRIDRLLRRSGRSQ